MSRIDSRIESNGNTPVDAAEILAALAADASASARKRQDAVARYLSASEGWWEACSELGGAFAPAEPKQ